MYCVINKKEIIQCKKKEITWIVCRVLHCYIALWYDILLKTMTNQLTVCPK